MKLASPGFLVHTQAHLAFDPVKTGQSRLARISYDTDHIAHHMACTLWPAAATNSSQLERAVRPFPMPDAAIYARAQ